MRPDTAYREERRRAALFRIDTYCVKQGIRLTPRAIAAYLLDHEKEFRFAAAWPPEFPLPSPAAIMRWAKRRDKDWPPVTNLHQLEQQASRFLPHERERMKKKFTMELIARDPYKHPITKWHKLYPYISVRTISNLRKAYREANPVPADSSGGGDESSTP